MSKKPSFWSDFRDGLRQRGIRVALLAGVFTAIYNTIDNAVIERFFTAPTGIESFLIAGSLIGLLLTLILGALLGHRIDDDFCPDPQELRCRRFTAGVKKLLSSLIRPSRAQLSPSGNGQMKEGERKHGQFSVWWFWAFLTGLAGAGFTYCTLRALDEVGVVGYLPFVQLSIIVVFIIENLSRQRCRGKGANVRVAPWGTVLVLLFVLAAASLATVLRSLKAFEFDTSALPVLFGVVASSTIYTLFKQRGMGQEQERVDAVTFRFVSFFWTTVFLFIYVFGLQCTAMGWAARWSEVWGVPLPKLLVIALSMVFVFLAFTFEYVARKKVKKEVQLSAWIVNSFLSVSVAVGAIIQFLSWAIADTTKRPSVYFAGAEAFTEQPTELEVWVVRFIGAVVVFFAAIVCAWVQKEFLHEATASTPEQHTPPLDTSS